MSNGIRVFDVRPCADLIGYSLQGSVGQVQKTGLLQALVDEGFRATYLDSRSCAVASREGVTLILHESGEFSLSRVSSPDAGVELMNQILGSIRRAEERNA